MYINSLAPNISSYQNQTCQKSTISHLRFILLQSLGGKDMSTPWKTPHLSDSPEVTWDVEMTLLFLVSAGKEQQEQRIATKMVFHHVYIITNLHVLQSLDVFFLPLCCVCVCVTSHRRNYLNISKSGHGKATDQTYSLIAWHWVSHPIHAGMITYRTGKGCSLMKMVRRIWPSPHPTLPYPPKKMDVQNT